MPRQSSDVRKFEAIILGYPRKAWNFLKSKQKLEIWKEVYKKQTPDKLQIQHEFSDRFYKLAESELGDYEAGIFNQAQDRLGLTTN